MSVRKRKYLCMNPRCGIEDFSKITSKSRRTQITPSNALYKDERGETKWVIAPKTFSKKWCTKILPLDPTDEDTNDLDIETNVVYCPRCRTPLELDHDMVHISVLGPPSCGKTVYLTVLNELFKTSEFYRVNFNEPKDASDNDKFKFQSVLSESGIRYHVFPKGTNVNEFHYMSYQMSHNQNEIGKFGHTPPNSIMKRPCDLLLYDIAGEWANEQGKDQDRYMRIKTAHLDNSELIIFMINLSHLLGLGSSTDPNMQKYSQTITETIKRIKKNKRNKNCHIAFCIVAGDIVETRSVANFDRLAPLRQESIRKNFYKDDTISFNMTEYEAAKVEIMKAFPALFNFRMSSNYGVFFLSAVGSNPIREAVDQNGTSCECFSRFDAKASINWGVTNPIMWYLAKQGIIGQSK